MRIFTDGGPEDLDRVQRWEVMEYRIFGHKNQCSIYVIQET